MTDFIAAGDQLITNCANVFDSKFTPDLNNLYPALIEAANKERRKIIRRKKIIVSSGGTHFISFAKSSKFGKGIVNLFKKIYCWFYFVLQILLYF